MSAFGDAAYKSASDAKVKAERALQAANAEVVAAKARKDKAEVRFQKANSMYEHNVGESFDDELVSAKRAQQAEAFGYDVALRNQRDAQDDYNEAFANWRQAAQMLE